MAVEQSEVTTYSVAPRASAYQHAEHYVPMPKSSEDGRIVAHAVQTILREPEALYRLWSDVEFIPRWQEFVVNVTAVSPTRSHWVMGDPEDADGKRIEFDSEITKAEPSKLIAWQSVTEGVDLRGSVTFEDTARGTRVVLVQEANIPGGTFGSALIGTAKRSPQQVVKENLRHFKQLAETGEIPTVVGQPNGPRGLSGKLKSLLYGENNPTPPGTSTH